MNISNSVRSLARVGAVVCAFALPLAFGQNFLVNKKFVDTAAPGGNQVNVLGPGQRSFLEFNLFNSASGALTANMTDALPGGMRGDPTFTPVVTGSGCSAAGATLTATAGTISITNFTLPNVPAAGTGPDCRVVFRVIGDPAGAGGNSNVTNTVPAASTAATGPGGPYQSDPFSASLQVLPVINASMSKAFSPATVPLNGTSSLSIVIGNNAQYPLNNVAISDSLPPGAVPTSGAATSSCGGTATVSGQTVSLSGGTIPPGGSCTITVPVTGTTAGDKLNAIPASTLTTREGVTNDTPATAMLSVKDNLQIAKLHDYASSINLTQGEVFLTTISFTNNAGALTAATLRDQLPSGVVLADAPNFSSSCGGIFSGAPGTSLVNVTGMTIPAANLAGGTAGTCSVNFWTKIIAATGSLTNTIATSDVTNAQGKVPEAPASAVVIASAAPGGTGAPGGGNWGYVDTYKDFVDANNQALSVIDVNLPFWLRLGTYNPGYDWRFTNGVMTDVLPLGTQVDVAGGSGMITLVNGIDVKYQTTPNGSAGAGPNNSTGPYDFSGCANTGTVTVTRSAAGQDTVTYSGFSTEKGSVSQGGSWYSAGCWVSLRLKGVATGAYTGAVAPAKPINTIPTNSVTFTEPVTNPNAVTAPVTILSAIDLVKSFNPYVVNNGGGKTRLTVFLTNKSASPEPGAAVTDVLPSGAVTAVVATPPNATTTCTPGIVNATAGGLSVGITGATIPAGTLSNPGRCSFSVDVVVSGSADSNIDNVIAPGALTSSTPGLVNIVEARGALATRSRGIILNKTFGNGGAAQGGQPVPLTITVTPDNFAMTNVGFVDTLPPGVTVAPVPNASTTCRTIDALTAPKRTSDGSIVNFPSTTPATVTVAAGGTTIALTKAYFVGVGNAADMGAYASCTVTVDVVAGTTGNKTNTIPSSNATNDQGATNISPSSATLTVQPNTQLVKAFAPANVAVGSPFTLTLTVFNVNVSPQADFFIIDTLPVNIVADSIASNSCGGTPTITSGGSVIDLPATGTLVGPDGRCDLVVNVRATATGAYTNDQNNLNVSSIINKTTSTTVNVNAPTVFDLSITKTLTSAGPYSAGTSSATYSLVATNNGPGSAQERIVVSDCLPVGLSYTSATGTGWACVNNAGPITRGALTCSSEVVCTRGAGTGTILSAISASPITITAALAVGASGALTNYAKVAPAVGETLTETNPLGITNGGYELGSTADSNNDASAPLTAAISYSLGNRVWLDLNNSGTADAADGASPGRDGVVVELLNSSNVVIGNATTAGGGYYRFDNLPAGDYKVRIASINFSGAGALAGYASSVPTETDPNANIDSNDNGIDTPVAQLATNGVTSGTVTLGPATPEPLNENDLVGGAAAGNDVANGGADNTGNMTVDFGFYRLASLGNYVWYDTNRDGQQTAGELPAQGVRVTLVDSAGVPVPGVAAKTTGSDGLYLFTDLPPGTYGVIFSNLPTGYTFTLPLQGGNAAIDSDANATTGRSGNVTLAAGDQNLTLDAGLVPLAGVAVGNYVWIDANRNGIQDATEVGVPGVNATISKVGGGAVTDVFGNTLTSTTVATGGDGSYGFTNLAPGQYIVTFNNVPASYSVTTTSSAGSTTANDSNGLTATSRVLASGESDLTLDLGITPTFALGNRVWLDSNNNGAVDAGEVGLDGLTVRLLDVAGGTVATTTTAAGGYYLFSGLAEGKYQVEIDPPANYVTSTGINGSATGPVEAGSADFTLTGDNKDHGTKQANSAIRSAVVMLAPGMQPLTEGKASGSTDATPDENTNLTVDFGLFSPAKLGNLVWLDTGTGGGVANNGKQDGSEFGLNNVTVRVLSAAGIVLATTRTGNDPVTGKPGWYELGNLIPGQYQVEFIAPDGYRFATKGPAAIVSGSGSDTSNSQVTDSLPRTALVTLAAGDNNPQLDAGLIESQTAIPTLNEWMVMLLAMLMVAIATMAMRRR